MAKRNTRIDMYLNWAEFETYANTDKEQELVNKFTTLYELAKSAQDQREEASPENLAKWRKAYKGTLNALTKDGVEGKRFSRKLRKTCFEIVESMIDNNIPSPKMMPRYKRDIPVVHLTEDYLNFEVGHMMTKYVNDENERATYVDGTSWFKVYWDSLDRTSVRNGDVKIKTLTCDQVVPQPGVKDYRKLEYIFERCLMSTTVIYDLYGRVMIPNEGNTNMIEVINCYYLNENRIVGLFSWNAHSLQVICNEKDWQIRKLRKCTYCDTIVPIETTCPVCHGKRFKFENATTEILSEPLYEIYNPYDEHETDDPEQKDIVASREFLPAGSRVPFYVLRQLPFVPRPALSSLDSIYGRSEVEVVLDMQDVINKILTKAVDKTLKSGAVVTKPDKLKISDMDDTFKVLSVRTSEEAAMVQTKQIVADTSQDMALSATLYDSAKSSSGITDSFQGKKDPTATSGKAKEYSAMLAAGRIESLRSMKSAAYAGVYELVFKYLLAFSDEPRKFVKVLPDGSEKEQQWNKYMFLSKDKYGNVYYRDDFKWDTDAVGTLSNNRPAMWQETQDKFIQGAFGNPSDPRAQKLFWNTMEALSYPLAKIALAGITESEQHLPFEMEQAIMQNPEIMQMIQQMLTDSRGGARPNSGPDGNGATHAANVERTNERNRAEAGRTEGFSPQMVAGQGG